MGAGVCLNEAHGSDKKVRGPHTQLGLESMQEERKVGFCEGNRQSVINSDAVNLALKELELTLTLNASHGWELREM